MSTIVEASVPAAQFALSETLESVADAEFRVVRHVAHGGDEALPFLWARAADQTRLRRVLERDDSAAAVEVVGEFEEETLLRIEWSKRPMVLVSVLGDEDATILDARARDDTWHLRLCFPEHESVATAYERCREAGVDVTVDRICDLSDARRRGNLGLTDEQYAAISQAYDAGYYDVPRKINQEELARSFDVSHQALSERLRRGHQTVVANVLYRKLDGPDQAAAPRVGRPIDS